MAQYHVHTAWASATVGTMDEQLFKALAPRDSGRQRNMGLCDTQLFKALAPRDSRRQHSMSLSDSGYHLQGRQQKRKLPNRDTGR